MDLRREVEHLKEHDSSGKRYKQDLKNTKALLRDAQQAIEQLVRYSLTTILILLLNIVVRHNKPEKSFDLKDVVKVCICCAFSYSDFTQNYGIRDFNSSSFPFISI